MMMQVGGTTTTGATEQTNDAAAMATTADVAAVDPLEGTEEMSDRGFGGNRWPRQETLALLKIRSDMDITFRDASFKGPLWEEVSRKMADLGYNRNAKKCKEKFENVYKYHKRTKENRTGKSEGKAYRFFDQLEALENQSSSSSVLRHHSSRSQPPPPLPPPPHLSNNTNSIIVSAPPLQVAVDTVGNPPPGIAVTSIMPIPSTTVSTLPPFDVQAISFPSVSEDFLSDPTSSSSSSTSSDVDIDGRTRKKTRKRKWKEFFGGLMKRVVEKQEELQRKFLETVEKREHERMIREEAWRKQEIARINRERELLAQERSMTAAKDAAVMAFLHKLSENPNVSQSLQQIPQTQPPPAPPPPQTQTQPKPVVTAADLGKTDSGDQNFAPASSSRWPKVEIEALIKLRTNLDSKYQENAPKGPLWEEISSGMRRLGFNRNAKRCKEKWENINKYFKKVKESNKKRPEDSKTCPYFHQLDALYREKNKLNFSDHNMASSSTSTSGQTKPESSIPLLVQPEQQWPPAPETQLQQPPDLQTEDMDQGENFDQNLEYKEGDDRDASDEDDDDEDDGGGEFEIVPSSYNKNVSLGISGRDTS